jgi:hypothetical protein
MTGQEAGLASSTSEDALFVSRRIRSFTEELLSYAGLLPEGLAAMIQEYLDEPGGTPPGTWEAAAIPVACEILAGRMAEWLTDRKWPPGRPADQALDTRYGTTVVWRPAAARRAHRSAARLQARLPVRMRGTALGTHRAADTLRRPRRPHRAADNQRRIETRRAHALRPSPRPARWPQAHDPGQGHAHPCRPGTAGTGERVILRNPARHTKPRIR